jgi:outer membrane protein assembly factor BamD
MLKISTFAPSIMIRRIIFFFVLFVAVLTGCNEFNRVQKNGTLDEKYEKAVDYYNKEDYTKAQLLFDELYSSIMRTSEKGEKVLYYLSYSNYHLGDYIMAGYLFRSYYKTFPTSPKSGECLYMSAYCYYQISPPYTLDQEDTYVALNQFQYFIQMFPNDTARIKECNKLVDDLHRKLEKKAFYNAKTYYQIQDYKAAISSFDQFLHDYPDTKYREEVYYLKADARYKLAQNSIDAKKEERVQLCIKDCNTFLNTFKESEYTDEVNAILEKAQKLQKQLADDQKVNSK